MSSIKSIVCCLLNRWWWGDAFFDDIFGLPWSLHDVLMLTVSKSLQGFQLNNKQKKKKIINVWGWILKEGEKKEIIRMINTYHKTPLNDDLVKDLAQSYPMMVVAVVVEFDLAIPLHVLFVP